MNQDSALALSKCESKEKIIEMFEAGEQAFPIISSVEIMRSTGKTEGDSQTDGQINFTIVAATEQPLEEKPTQATIRLLKFMPEAPMDTSCFLPSPLHAIQESDCYALQVQFPGMAVRDEDVFPCQKILSLIKSTQKSKPAKIGEVGYKIITENVTCLLAGDDSHLACAKHTLSSTCSLLDMPAYRLDAVRGKPQHALITITAKDGDVFIVDQVQLLDEEQAGQAKVAMGKLMFAAMHFHVSKKTRDIPWNEFSSLVLAKKCRILGRSATDVEIEPPLDASSMG